MLATYAVVQKVSLVVLPAANASCSMYPSSIGMMSGIDLTMLEARYFTTLHGFQCYQSWVSIGSISRWIKAEDGSHGNGCTQHVDTEEFYACANEICLQAGLPLGALRIKRKTCDSCLEVNIQHRDKIPQIIDAAVDCSYALRLKTKLRALYRPGSLSFSIEASEYLALMEIVQARKAHIHVLFDQLINDDDIKHLFAQPRLWKTAQGKWFCKLVRSGMTRRQLSELDRRLVHPTCGDFDPRIDYPMAQAPNAALITRSEIVPLPVLCTH